MKKLTDEQKMDIARKIRNGDVVELPKGAKIETTHFDVKITVDEYISWVGLIRQGKSLPPEITGLLLGRSRANKIVIFPEDE